jgi:hypothetical protein
MFTKRATVRVMAVAVAAAVATGPATRTSTSKGDTSLFKGVSWHKENSKWRAQIDIDGKRTRLGYFDDEEAAARAYDKAAAPLGHGGGASLFKGVSWSKGRSKWMAHITIDGKLTYFGSFDDEDAAARAYDEAAVRVGRPVNFPVGNSEASAVKGGRGGSSHFKGVCWNKSLIKWVATIMIDGKPTHLGCFDDEEAAARAYDEAAARLGRPLNFPAVNGGASAVKGGRGGTSHF